jgi:hypothetical protein
VCVLQRDGIMNDVHFILHFSVCLFFPNEHTLLCKFLKSNFPLGKITITSEFAKVFYEVLDGTDSQALQSFHQTR